MKNLEKIAIDSILQDFQNSKKEMIEGAISAKQAVEIAQQNFKKTAGPLVNYAKEAGNLLLEDGVTDEAITYFEGRMTEMIKIPFSLKKS
jgi:hypothetical protein